MKILIVDDYAIMRRLLKNFLNNIGITQITEADDGESAISLLKQNFRLIISDVNMSKIGGIDFVKYIRHGSLWNDIPFIMISSDPNKELKQISIAAGADDFLYRPFTQKELTYSIAKVLGARQPPRPKGPNGYALMAYPFSWLGRQCNQYSSY